ACPALPERALERALLPAGLESAPARWARAGERAKATAGDACEADRPAEIHERLGGRRREAVPRALRDPPHVDVDGQDRAAEGEAGDRVCRVPTDSRELGQVFGPPVRRDVLCRSVEGERAPVVAESLPLPD